MTPYYLWDATRKAFAAEIQAQKDRLATGAWKTEADARKLVGRIKGLEDATEILKAEYDKIETLDDEEHDESV